MIGKGTLKILNLILRSADLYNINQIARNLKLSVGGVHKTLKNWEEKGIVNAKELGNAIYYTLNFNNKEAIKLCELILIEEKNKLLKENKTARVYIQDLEKYPAKCILLFGSLLLREEQAQDVDTLFIIKNKKEIKTVNEFCLSLSKIRTKKVNPIIMLESDLTRNIKAQNKAIMEIVKAGIVLKGEEIFVKAIKNAR